MKAAKRSALDRCIKTPARSGKNRDSRATERNAFAGAVLTVDLGAIVENYHRLCRRAGTAECAAVVKADAYGLGAEPVSRALAKAGCTRFFVSTVDEAVAVRAALKDGFPDATICVLTGLPEGGADAFAAFGLTPVLLSLGQVDAWAGYCRSRRRRLDAMLKIDTGMSRLGLPADELDVLAGDPDRLAPINLTHVMSHLGCADTPDHPANKAQLQRFRAALKRLPPAKASLANSSGIFLGRPYHFDLVRPGAALYGVSPRPGRRNPMRPVVALHGKILQLRDVDTRTTVGYGAAHRMRKPGRLATVAIGYADGYHRSLGGRGSAFAGSVRVPVVGRISMDLTVFDVSAVPRGRLKPGDHLEIIGKRHTVDDVAAEAGTIGYEVLTSLGRRFERRYVGG